MWDYSTKWRNANCWSTFRMNVEVCHLVHSAISIEAWDALDHNYVLTGPIADPPQECADLSCYSKCGPTTGSSVIADPPRECAHPQWASEITVWGLCHLRFSTSSMGCFIAVSCRSTAGRPHTTDSHGEKFFWAMIPVQISCIYSLWFRKTQ